MENPPPYYSVYRFRWFWKAFAIFFLVFGAFASFAFWRGPLLGLADPKPVEMLIAVLFLAVGVVLTVHAFKAEIRFTIDAVEQWSILGSKQLQLNKISGRREFVVRDEYGSTRYMKLVPNDDRLATLSFSRSYTFDDSFYRWFYSLPDLDARDKANKGSNFGLI